MEDRYARLREMPFETLAGILGIDMSKFRSRKGGTEWSGPCPIHGGKKSGTAFSYADSGAFHCFSCSQKGKGAIDFAKLMRGIGFQAAVELLEPYAGNALAEGMRGQARRPEIRQTQEAKTENAPFRSTYEKFRCESEWLEARGVSAGLQERFGVFEYRNAARKSAYNGSVLVRISRYSDGETVAYLSRNIGEVTPEKPKYRFPEGFAKSLELFGAWQLKDAAPHRILYVVESPFSAMRFSGLGFPCVALLGCSVSERQADIIGELAKGVVALPDSDKRKEFAPSAYLLSQRVWVKCPEMPDGIPDPERLTAEQVKSLT